jgi:hypothetical protein
LPDLDLGSPPPYLSSWAGGEPAAELLGRPGVPTPAGGCSEGPAPGRLRPEASLRSEVERAVSRGVQGLETLHWPGSLKSAAEESLRQCEDCRERAANALQSSYLSQTASS